MASRRASPPTYAARPSRRTPRAARTLLRAILVASAVALSATLCACGSSGGSSGAGATPGDGGAHGQGNDDGAGPPTSDSGAGAGHDGSPSSPPPTSDSGAAAHAPLPQFVYGPAAGATGSAGPLLGAIQIVTATWDKAPTSDPLSTPLDTFGASLAQSAWWNAVRAGYCTPGGSCVGAGGTAIAHGVGDTPNPAITDTAFAATGNYSFKKFINDKTSAGDLPVPDANTLYVFYLPPGFSVTLDGAPTCGYHSMATVSIGDAGTATVPYVVIPRCQVTGMADIDVATIAASREIAEAATDLELAVGQPGFHLTDPAWSVTGTEIGDYCVGQTTTESGSAVQRIWSNEAAAGSHDPCVPAPAGEVYYSVAPEASVAQGLTIPVGGSTTFAATAFSDGATSSWTIAAQELSTASVLSVTFDKTTVNDGDTVNVTVKLTAQPTTTTGGKSYERFAIISSGADGRSHAWPVIVYAQ